MRPAFAAGEVRFALGAIGIGRPWGVVPGEIPSSTEAARFLADAYSAGVRYFDTAPSYGSSEERLGEFLRSLTPAERAGVTIATKFGEHWDEAAASPFVDHTFEALARSLDRSLDRLGTIDVLQLHKTSPAVLRSDALARAWEKARAAGIAELGTSVADLESAELTLQPGPYQMMQLPVNQRRCEFLEVMPRAEAAGIWLALNRPFAMGQVVVDAAPSAVHGARVEAFRFLLSQRFCGVVLSGTKSAAHLRENLEAFREAQAGYF